MPANETPKHQARRLAIRKIEGALGNLKYIQYPCSDLAKLDIQVLPMTLHNNKPPTTPENNFFLPKLLKEHATPDAEYPSFSPSDLAGPIEHARRISDYFGYCMDEIVLDSKEYEALPQDPLPKLWEYGIASYQWRAVGIGDTRTGPHRKCIIIHDINGDDRLLRGELVCICRIMAYILSRKAYVQHMVTPVMLFSFTGPHHGRLLIARQNQTGLTIYKSDLLDFEDPLSFKILLPWWFSSAVGDTTV